MKKKIQKTKLGQGLLKGLKEAAAYNKLRLQIASQILLTWHSRPDLNGPLQDNPYSMTCNQALTWAEELIKANNKRK